MPVYSQYSISIYGFNYNKMIIDLCSGYGGATQSFLRKDVITIDIDPKVKPDIIADVRFLPLRPRLKPKLLFSSPPCRFLSKARYFPRQGIQEALEIVGACLEAIPYLEPETWILENPKGRLRYFLGPPTHSINYKAYDLKNKRTDLWSNKKSLKRAFIPKHISKQISDFIN